MKKLCFLIFVFFTQNLYSQNNSDTISNEFSISGKVKWEKVISLSDLEKYPTVSLKNVNISCSPRREDKAKLVKGVLLKNILDSVTFLHEKSKTLNQYYFLFIASDGYKAFDEVFRRREQAEHRSHTAVEAEDHQAVGMQLRECLISLIGALRRRVKPPSEVEQPQEANFIDWSEVLLNQLCPGECNKELRQHLKNTAKATWQLVNWLTHDRKANDTASTIALQSCSTLVGHFIHILERERTDNVDECPLCKSRNIRTHFDISIEQDGDYYMTCGVCDWSSHP